LQTDYLDLYLIHWPFSFEEDERGYSKLDANGVAILKPIPISETWAAMEELLIQGKVRSIGVSNFTINHLVELLKVAKVKPSVNQVELHPFLPQHDLLTFCEKHGILVGAYSSLGSGKQPAALEHPTVLKIANDTKMTPAQVLLSWAITRGTPVIPKTSHPERLEENFDLRTLDPESMTAINAIPTRFRVINPVEYWKLDCFDGDL
jgi:diketogulonate reductase-like aldo/keto reductase